MKAYEIYPNEPVPAGFQKLSDVREKLGADELLRRLQLGRIVAFELVIEDGDRRPISIDDWCSEYASVMIANGRKYHYFSPAPPIDPADARQVFSYGQTGRLLLVEITQAEKVTLTTAPENGEEYLSPFLVMMIEASRHFKMGTNSRSPKKAEIEAYFIGKILPNGTPISASQASSMATFVRSPDAMKGGNTKV